MDISASLYEVLSKSAMDVLIDDRDERPGVKFKDADLIGIPVHVVIGEKTLKDNQIEIKDRRTKEIKKVLIENAVGALISHHVL
jgi:prolyl-tRNA synthetase